MTGLIGWWPLHEDSGNTAHDLSGNNNHGSLNGGVTQGVAGKGGLTGYSFDGSDDYVGVGDVGNVSSWTVSLWIYPEVVADHHNVLHTNYSAGYNTGVRFEEYSDGEFKIGVSADNNWRDYSILSSLTEDTWHHVVATGDPSTNSLKVYVDDTLQLDVSHSSWPSNFDNLTLGAGYDRSQEKRFYDGTISDVRIYDRALTLQEIQELHDWGSGGYARPLNDQNSSSAVARWPLDGDAGDVWNSNSGTVNGASVVDGVRGEAYDFNNSGDEIVVPNNSGFHGNGTGNFSVSAWVKPHSISNDSSNDRNTFAILRRAGTDPRVGWNLSFNSQSELSFLMEDSNNNQLRPVYSRSSNFDLSSWYHVVGVRNGDTARLYVNGVEKASSTTSGFGDISTSEELYIGQTNSTDSNYPDAFNGSVDDVRIYDRALRPEEVFELYRWGTGGRDLRKFTVNSR